MPVCIGDRTAIAAAIATHASAAFPPASRVRRPATAAVGCSQATATPVPKTVERPPTSGLLMMVSPLSDTDPGPPLGTHDLSYSLSKGAAGILAVATYEEAIHGQRQRNLRRRDPTIHPALARPLLLRQA